MSTFTVTEEEIYQGLINDPDRKDHCLVYIRELNNINHGHKKAWRFIDLKSDGSKDEEALRRLKDLQETVESTLPDSNIFK